MMLPFKKYIVRYFILTGIMLWIPQLILAQKLPAKTTTLIYIDQYKDIAVAEMKRTGIPASIILAQGIIESNSGESNLAANFNNHFGIKCKSDWKGETTYQDDDTKQECFRVYPSALYSYIDHSNFIKTRPNYAPLFELDPVDDSAWAYGLKKAGYATAIDYPKKLLKVIDDYELSQYNFPELENEKDSSENLAALHSDTSKPKITLPKKDTIIKDTLIKETLNKDSGITNEKELPTINKVSGIQQPSSNNTSTPVAINSVSSIKTNIKDTSIKTINPALQETSKKSEASSETKAKDKYPNKLFKINQVPVIWATKGTSYLQIAKEHNIPLYKIFKYNDIPESDLINQSQLIFLAAKKKEGATTFHTIQKGETLHEISQEEGIQLSLLKLYNPFIQQDSLKIGTQLLLIQPKESKSKIVLNKK